MNQNVFSVVRASPRRSILAGALIICGLAWMLSQKSVATEVPKVRPTDWAQPVLHSTLGNFYRVSDDVYRSEQPAKGDIPDLQALQIHTILNLRDYFHDSSAFEKAGCTLARHPMTAGSVSTNDLVVALKELKKAKKPILVHCWHGSDRTGFVIAGYRMVFQGWSKEKAIEELRSGGYGYHATSYPNIVKTLNDMDLPALKKAVLE